MGEPVTYGKPVYVPRGRRLHYALNFDRTVCGQEHHGVVVTSLDTPPICKRCWWLVGCSPMPPRSVDSVRRELVREPADPPRSCSYGEGGDV